MRNPLVRRSDRIEGVLAAIATLIALVAIPFAMTIGSADIAAETAASEAQLQSRHQVTATVLTTAAQPAASVGDSAPIANTARVNAVWKPPNGAQRTGVITVPSASATEGSTTEIWLDNSGKQTTAPLTHADAVTNGVLVAAFCWLCVVAVLAGAFWVARRVLDHRRAARWAAEWAQLAGPEAVR
ncbi:Rv1733c family protein [Amycolatopsis silviterrae]|uniref:Transmembrane protein n=1 Tax=Amycolatopsis silviterrae TaxID=1656914 RepID=A0ABW5HM94_9PSEU